MNLTRTIYLVVLSEVFVGFIVFSLWGYVFTGIYTKTIVSDEATITIEKNLSFRERLFYVFVLGIAIALAIMIPVTAWKMR